MLLRTFGSRFISRPLLLYRLMLSKLSLRKHLPVTLHSDFASRAVPLTYIPKLAETLMLGGSLQLKIP